MNSWKIEKIVKNLEKFHNFFNIFHFYSYIIFFINMCLKKKFLKFQKIKIKIHTAYNFIIKNINFKMLFH